MKIIYLLFASLAMGQTLQINSPVTKVVPGQSVPVNVVFASPPPGGIAAIEWSFTTPAGWTLNTAATMTGAPTKQAQCGIAICLASGLDKLPLAAGATATVNFTVPANAPAGAATVTLVLPPPPKNVASDPNGIAVPISVTGAPIVFQVATFDLNGDGKVTMADMKIEVDQITGVVPCTNGDFGGACSTTDFQKMVGAWLAAGSQP